MRVFTDILDKSGAPFGHPASFPLLESRRKEVAGMKNSLVEMTENPFAWGPKDHSANEYHTHDIPRYYVFR